MTAFESSPEDVGAAPSVEADAVEMSTVITAPSEPPSTTLAPPAWLPSSLSVAVAVVDVPSEVTAPSAELSVALGAAAESVTVDALGNRESYVPVVWVEDCVSESDAGFVASVEEAGREVSGDTDVDAESAPVTAAELTVD